jgi:hypothetical protein
MSDVAAGSNAALQLQRNMAAAPDVQQMQTNVMQEQANTLQQQQQNLEKTKLANLVADAGIKSDADIKSKIQNLVKDDSYIKASPSEQALKLASVYGEAGKAEDSAKFMQISETITNKDLVNQSKKLDIERQAIADASSVLETIPEAQVNERFNSLPEATRNLVINRVGPANWNNFSPKEKKAVVQNLFETTTAKLQEQKFANNLALAQIRSNERLLAQRQRDEHSEKVRNSTRDENTRMWGTVVTAIDRVQRDPATIKERERLDEEVAKAETKALESTYFRSYKPEGSDTEFYSKPAYDKYMQAIRKRDKHIAAQLDEEEALIKTLPAAAGTLRQSQLDKIERQRGTLQLEEPGAKKKVEAAPAVTTPAKPDVTSSKIPEIRPLSLNPDGSSVRTGLGWPSKDVLLKANDAIMNGADVEAVTKRMRDAGYDITTKDLTPEYVEYAKKQKK